MMEPKIIKFKPYVGGSDENAKGKKTKIILKEDTLEYDVCYEQTIQVRITKEDSEKTVESPRYVEEVGVKTKDSITNIVKYTKTDYDDEGVPDKIYSLDICSPSVTLSFEVDNEQDRNNLYEELYNWKFNMDNTGKREGKSTIKWMPHGRNLVFSNDLKNSEDSKRLQSLGLIDPKSLPDAELLKLGGVSKSAEIANRTSEDQEIFEVVAVGPEVAYVNIGDKIMVRSGGQFTTFKVGDKYYVQVGEYDILGKFID